jgi:nucleotide-binding universal stress UspA family protein
MVPTTCGHAWPTDRALKIMVALDGSDLAEKALGPATEFAGSLRATLLLVRVTDSRAHSYAAGHTYVGLEASPELGEVRAYLECIAGRLRAAGRDVEVHEDLGAPAQTVAAVAAEQNVDLIAMWTHGHDDRGHLVLGDVATSTLVRSPLPILFVRSVPMQDCEACPGAAARPRA